MQREMALKSRLRQIMVLGSALAAGFAVGSLEALQPDFSFKISAKTVIAFALGAAVLGIYWSILLNPSKTPRRNRLRWMASAALFLAGVAGFLYPLRFIAPNNYPDVIIGLGAALCGIGVVAVLLLACKRFLDRDSESITQERGNERKALTRDEH